jgi:glutaredoxin
MVPYETLLDIFWRQIDPTDPEGQFADKGSQYRTAIFYHDDDQKRLAEISKRDLDASRKFAKPVTTEIRPYTNFYPAEEYHQNYDTKNPRRYGQYEALSGREPFIKRTWGTSRVVRVYATPGCSGCRVVKEFLRSRGVAFTEIDMAADEGARKFVLEKTGHLSSPIIQIGDEFIIGFDRKKMEKALG